MTEDPFPRVASRRFAAAAATTSATKKPDDDDGRNVRERKRKGGGASAASSSARRRRRRPHGRRATIAVVASSLLLLLPSTLLLVASPRRATAFGGVTETLSDWWDAYVPSSLSSSRSSSSHRYLTMLEISDMRARDMKRRLQRSHGYGADEVAKMMDKKELIEALSYEEHKAQKKEDDRVKRETIKRSAMVGLAGLAIWTFRPVMKHAWEVGAVNFVVYTDRKKYEASRCVELRSSKGFLGVLFMLFLDFLQLWLSISVLLSWLPTTRFHPYKFPIPRLPVKPAALLAGATGGNAGPLGEYGINVGPMVVTWLLRYANGRVEAWVGRALSSALRTQKAERKETRRKERETEGGDDPASREARKAERARRRAEREERRRRRAEREEAEGIAARKAAMKAEATEEARERGERSGAFGGGGGSGGRACGGGGGNAAPWRATTTDREGTEDGEEVPVGPISSAFDDVTNMEAREAAAAAAAERRRDDAFATENREEETEEEASSWGAGGFDDLD